MKYFLVHLFWNKVHKIWVQLFRADKRRWALFFLTWTKEVFNANHHQVHYWKWLQQIETRLRSNILTYVLIQLWKKAEVVVLNDWKCCQFLLLQWSSKYGYITNDKLYISNQKNTNFKALSHKNNEHV